MTIALRPAERVSKALLFVALLTCALLGIRLVPSRGDANIAVQAAPARPLTADQHGFIGTVPRARSDEPEITPVESVGAARERAGE